MAEYAFYSIDNAGVMVGNNIDCECSSVLFLDRDGIIIKDVGHISKKVDVELVPGIDKLIHRSRDAGMLIVVVTNQSSVARGIISVEEYIDITNQMVDLLPNSSLDMIVASFYHPMFSPNHCNSSWRKPGPGMFEYVLQNLNVDVTKCIMIGDRSSDILAAQGVGIQINYFLRTIRYPDEATVFKGNPRWKRSRVKIIESLDEVVLTDE